MCEKDHDQLVAEQAEKILRATRQRFGLINKDIKSVVDYNSNKNESDDNEPSYKERLQSR